MAGARAARVAALALGTAAAVAVVLGLAPAFSTAPGAGAQLGTPSTAQQPNMGPPSLASPVVACLAVAAVAAASLGAGISQRRARPRATACSAVRRDLAVAYEDSGIDLIDNGKFAQGLVGSEGAWGRYEFDPIGFSRFTELVPFFREAELKHGRICMLAWTGLVVPDFVRIPGERYSFEEIPVTIDSHNALASGAGPNAQILFWISIVEFCCAKKVFEWNSAEVAGDYNIGIQFLPKDEEGQRRMRLAELKNGRLAMIAFGGAITQAALTRHPFPWLF